jgi:hypothetical protein
MFLEVSGNDDIGLACCQAFGIDHAPDTTKVVAV